MSVERRHQVTACLVLLTFAACSIGYQKLNKKDTCATVDWVQNDPKNWTCTVANAEGITLQNAHFNRESIAKMWKQIAERCKNDSGVFFELSGRLHMWRERLWSRRYRSILVADDKYTIR